MKMNENFSIVIFSLIMSYSSELRCAKPPAPERKLRTERAQKKIYNNICCCENIELIPLGRAGD